MSFKKEIPETELNEFREYAKNVKPLNKKSIHIEHKKKSLKKVFLEKESQQEILMPVTDPNISSEEVISFHRSGLQHKLLRKLRQGQIIIEAELDLHGLTVAEAQQQLLKFIKYAQAQNMRCVRIIHGKGRRTDALPILKNNINAWLKQLPEILAFHSARFNDGGTGAVYVLLRANQ